MKIFPTLISRGYWHAAGADGSAADAGAGVDAGAGSETTTSTTTQSESGSSGAQTADSDFDFAELATFDSYAEGKPEAKPVIGSEASTTGQPAAPAAQPAPAASTQPVPAAAPAVPQTQQVEQPGQVQATTATTQTQATGKEGQTLTPEQVIQQHRESYMPQLRELYKLSDAEIEQSRTNPEQFFPEMAARLHYEVQMSTHNTLVQMLPQFIESVVQQKAVREEANNKFYDQWPKLKEAVSKNPEVEETIRNTIKAFRSVNPKADLDTIIKQAGLMSMMTMGLPLEMPGQGGQVQGQQSAQGQPSPVQQQMQQPTGQHRAVRPAGIGATAHVPAPRVGSEQEGNIFAELVDDYEAGNL